MEPTSDPINWNLPQPTGQGSDGVPMPPSVSGVSQASSNMSAPDLMRDAGSAVNPYAQPTPIRQEPMMPASSTGASTYNEKQWAEQAKTIVERTKDDPWQQSREIMQLRVEYLQKHHGKTSKVND
ncbi:MAG TPA: hypothetical protein VHD60_00915 [Candidatus Saccharimonadales bacterium]|nr:hypothetical protein [Candidatus Saccharimonadales bacterium]